MKFDAVALRRIRAAPPERPETQQWEIDVIDSARSGHGKTDTRPKASAGVGRGVLRVYTNKEGHVAGYTWSINGTREQDYHNQDEHLFVVGRLIPHFKPRPKGRG